MTRRLPWWRVVISALLCSTAFPQESLKLNKLDYFELPGLNVMAFQDIYPDGHQGGVNIIQNGIRVASNGDIRLDPAPGQWSPLPKQLSRVVNRVQNEITATLAYPDPERNRRGFNPIDYPNLNFSYTVHVRGEGQSVRITVDLDKPLPAEWVGKVGFNLELYPTSLFGKTWYLGGASGIFPRQANGPDHRVSATEIEPVPLASGPRLSIAPDNPAQFMTIESRTGDLSLLDARSLHNNGWFVVRSLVLANAATRVIDWTVTPHAIPGWKYQPVVHVSQIGYHPKQKKVAIIELDGSASSVETAKLERISESGGVEEVLAAKPAVWGEFLRYKYLQFDFTSVTRPGMYVVDYGAFRTEPFQISKDVYDRHVWQPVLEYFLPAQMCHMRVEENYKVWHGVCHLDDARMAPVAYNHFDGYIQGPSTLTSFKPGDTVPGLDRGGWHDAGDDDFRIESQAGEVFILASAYEAFHVAYDDTSIDETKCLTNIHVPDGRPDILQQVEHGLITILGSYENMGRVYRGIISSSLPQYKIIMDTANATDNLHYDAALKPGERTGAHSSVPDDRWVFTEEDPSHEYKAVAALALSARVLKDYDPPMAKRALAAAEGLWNQPRDLSQDFNGRISAAVELWLTTRDKRYSQMLAENRALILKNIAGVGWSVGRALPLIEDPSFVADIRKAVAAEFAKTVALQKENPFGVPYHPYIWGAGWQIQEFGVEQYYLHHAFPETVPTDYLLNALNFILGVHPGENTASFASGIGARSMTVAYGFNRADWTYIPGGVTSGTALIRPDFPELKDFPYLWQQGEYVMGGGSSNFMFLVLAAQQALTE